MGMGVKYVLGSESRGLVVGSKEEGRIRGDHYVPGLGGWGFCLADGHQEFSFGHVVESGLKWKQCNRCELSGVRHRVSLVAGILLFSSPAFSLPHQWGS